MMYNDVIKLRKAHARVWIGGFMSNVQELNKQIELLFQFWDGKITEEEFHKK